MLIKQLFSRSRAAGETCADALHTARRSLRRRDRRIAYLLGLLKRERKLRARELAGKNDTIAALQQLLADHAPAVPTGTGKEAELEQELAAVSALLSDFESDACRAQAATARAAELEDENRAQAAVIETLESELDAWRYPQASAA